MISILSSIELCYEIISRFLVWYNYSFYESTPKSLKSKMIQLPPLSMEEIEKELTLVDKKYPFVFPDRTILACLVVGGFILLAGTAVLL